MKFLIWQRYLLQHFLRIFLLFLICFYGLYVLIDYASHTTAFAHHKTLQWIDILRYYIFVFASRAEILIPLALLIALVQTLCTFNSRYEIVALMAGGLSLRQLMRPFIWAGLFCTLLMYNNEQFLLPKALHKLRKFEEQTKHQKNRHSQMLAAQHVILEDGSLLIYQKYEPTEERFFDAYWIESPDSIYRMKYLYPNYQIPAGHFVDYLKRQVNGTMIQETAHRQIDLPKIKFNPELLQSAIMDPDILSITELGEQVFKISHVHEKESKILTAFFWKLSIPWLCLIAILAPAPFCMNFSRTPPVFLIYACSLFGLIAFYMFMDATQVIAKRQVFSPLWAICGPFFLMFGYFYWRFCKKFAPSWPRRNN
jgi:lipopolysaccharide export system permease protein